jgi:hypothetical protein
VKFLKIRQFRNLGCHALLISGANQDDPEPLLHNGEDLSVVSSRSLPLNCGLAPIYFVRLRVAVLENRLPDLAHKESAIVSVKSRIANKII